MPRGRGLFRRRGPLVTRLAELVPEGGFMYEPGSQSDQPSEVMLAELSANRS